MRKKLYDWLACEVILSLCREGYHTNMEQDRSGDYYHVSHLCRAKTDEVGINVKNT